MRLNEVIAFHGLVMAGVLTLGTMPAKASCVPPAPGLIGWWSGNGDASDSASTNNGILVGNATATAPGLVGSAFHFDGISGHVRVPDSPLLRPANLTVECWVRFDSLNSSGTSPQGNSYIVFRQNTRNYIFEGFNLSKHRLAGGDFFVWEVSSASGLFVQLTSLTPVTTGVWYHLAGVRGSNYLQLYVNGQLESTGSVNFPQSYGNYPLYFGTSGQAFWDRKLAGSIDEVSLYNRALSAGEIAAIYTAGAEGKCMGSAPPTIISQPQSQTVVAEANALFSVSSAGAAPLSYQWQTTNGLILNDGGPVSGAQSNVLALSGVQFTDATGYQVVVTNEFGAVTSAVAVLTVVPAPVPPNILAQPASQMAAAGGDVAFHVIATGTAPLSYQWQRSGTNLPNGGTISGATASTLMLANVQLGDAAPYRVLITNLGGYITSMTAQLTVLVPPDISMPPESQTTLAGNDVSFSVLASGTLPLGYQWLFNGTSLADGGQFNGVTSPTLFMHSAQPNNAGAYSVVVSNAVGVVTSMVATLTLSIPGSCVPAPPGAVGWWPGDGTAEDIAGTNNGLLQGNATASAIGYVGQALSFDGISSFVRIPDSPSLRPTNLTIEAWVLFTSLNSSGNATVGQQFIVFRQNTRSYAFEGFYLGKERVAGGDRFMFDVTSASGQLVEVASAPIIVTGRWYHVAAVRGPDSILLYTNGQFAAQAPVTFPQSYGNYPLHFGSSGQSFWDRKLAGRLDEVSIYNRALSAAEIAAIYDAGAGGKCKGPSAPAILSQPQNQNVVIENNAAFSVAAAGTAPLQYQWQTNSVDLADGGRISGAPSNALLIANAQFTDASSYRVIVTNIYGKATSDVAMLTVTPAPIPPSIVTQPASQLLVPGSTAAFSVGADGTMPLSYQWQFGSANLMNGGRVSGATTPALTIANVQAADAGSYRVIVTNSGGAATSQWATLSADAPPLNDAFVRAQAVVARTIPGNTLNATKEAVEPDHAGNPGGASIWFAWTAPSTNDVTFDTAQSDFDTLLAVYTGNAVTALIPVASNDNLSEDSACSRLTFRPVAGVTYFIAVDGADGAAGQVTLRWVQAGTPLPDLVIIGSAVNPVVRTETFSSTSCAVIEGLIQAGTRRLVRFNTQTANLGNADLVLGNPVNNPLFEYASCHGHYHLLDYMAYRLRDSNGAIVAVGQKVGFCILDVARVSPTAATSTRFNCSNQGIQVGWSDIYGYTLDGQWIDITGVPNGSYLIELDVNAAGILLESDYSKNSTFVPLTLGIAAAAPPNDDFANATALFGGSPAVTGTTQQATRQSGEPNHAGNSGGHSIWYQWTAPASTPVIIDTLNSTFDTLLAVYTGTSLSPLTLVASNDDITRNTLLQSRVTFTPTAGNVYRIAVDGFNGAAGNIVLTLNQTIENDNFTNYVYLGGSLGTVYGTTVGATREPGEPLHAGNSGGHSIWYRWTAPIDGTVQFDTLGSTFDTLLAAYIGTTLANISTVASNDDIVPNSNPQSEVSFSVTSGTQFVLAIDGFGGASGNTVLNWTVAPSPTMLTSPSEPEPGSLESGAPMAPFLAYRVLENGELELTVTDSDPHRCVIETSVDLVHWSELQARNVGESALRISAPTTGTCRFYRVKCVR